MSKKENLKDQLDNNTSTDIEKEFLLSTSDSGFKEGVSDNINKLLSSLKDSTALTEIQKQLTKVQQEAGMLQKDSQKPKTILGKVLNVVLHRQSKLEERNKTLKAQVNELVAMAEKKKNEVADKMPQIESIIQIICNYDEQADEEIELVDQIIEKNKNELDIIRLKYEKNPDQKINLSFQKDIMDINDNIDTAVAKRDNLISRKSAYSLLFEQSKDILKANKDIYQKMSQMTSGDMQIIQITTANTILNNEIEDHYKFITSVSQGLDQMIQTSMKQSNENKLAISKIKKDGMLRLETFEKIYEDNVKTNEQIQRDDVERLELYAQREKSNKELQQKLNRDRVNNLLGSATLQLEKHEEQKAKSSSNNAVNDILNKLG